MNRIKFFAISIILFCFIACNRDNEFNRSETTKTIEGDFYIQGSVNGRILGENNQPISSALTSLNGKTTQTDENGFFRFKDINISNSGSLIKVQKDGYFDAFKFTQIVRAENSYLEIKLIPNNVLGTFNSDVPAEVKLNGNARVSLPANITTLSDGTPYEGKVSISGYWFDPNSEDLGTEMPGDLRGINEDAEEVQLATYGMMAVELEGEQGQKLSLKEGMKATLIFPQAAGNNTPNTIPMWHLDEESGIWVEEGTATLVENSYVGEVSHFSFWNCDIPFPCVSIYGKVVNKSLTPLANKSVYIRDNNSGITTHGYTNERGIFKGKVPKDIDLTLSMKICGDEKLEINLGALTEDTNLGDIILTDNISNLTNLTGFLTDCQGGALTNSYFIINVEGIEDVYIHSAEGPFNIQILTCENLSGSLKVYNLDTGQASDAQFFSTSENQIALGEINVCDDFNSEEFIIFRRGTGPEVRINSARVSIINDNYVYINSEQGVQPELNFIDIFNSTDQNLISFATLVNIGSIGNQGQYGTTNFSFPLSFTPEGQLSVGDFIEGETSNSVREFFFKLKVDEKISSPAISGVAWQDLNENGIRESGEALISGKTVRLNGPFDNPIVETKTDAEGKFSFPLMRPDHEYYLSYELIGDEELTTANQSDDENDSDFLLQDISTYATESFFLTAGEEVTNIGLGFTSLSELRCDIDYICCPPQGFTASIIGGSPPFEVTTYTNGQIYNQESYTSNTFSHVIADQGIYTITIIDVDGIECKVRNFEVGDYANNISGKLWLDNPSGIPDENDQGDIILVSVEVILVNSQNEEIRTTRTDANGEYVFNNMPEDSYRIKVVPPNNYEFLTQGDSEDPTKSHIDPNTGFSHEEMVGRYDLNIPHIINAGLKQ